MKTLSALLDLLKSKGVASYTGPCDGERVCVTFQAAGPVPLQPMPTQLGETEAEVCACGHPEVGDHNENGCLRGCDPADCDPPKKKARTKK